MLPPYLLKRGLSYTQSDNPAPLVTEQKSLSLSHKRTKIWEISPYFYCSIVGTCLTAYELRQFFKQQGDPDAPRDTDHTLHNKGTLAAGRIELGAKALNKALDRRHEAAIRRFGKASSPIELRVLWRDALNRGDISGPFWALLTHPATDAKLAHEVFGDVHMLSHQLGAAARTDIARLRQLEAELAERDEKLARQQTRLAEAARERQALNEQVANLNAEIAALQARASQPTSNEDEIADLRRRLGSESAHAQTLANKLDLSERQRSRAEEDLRALDASKKILMQEIESLESEIKLRSTPNELGAVEKYLLNFAILYVGGRPNTFGNLRDFVETRGGTLALHDGGVEDSLALLPGLIGQADLILFPVDCISHSAAERVKQTADRLSKTWLPLRTASFASFIRAIESQQPRIVG